MVIEQNIPYFFDWLPGAAMTWCLTLAVLLAATWLISVLWMGLRLGPSKAFQLTWKIFRQALGDIFAISFRRVKALMFLTFREAIRRKIVIGFIVFIFIVLFAGMFLDPTSKHPAQLYVNFIFSATSYLVLLLVLLLTAFSLPGDIKRKTIHTIVTKPVKISEVVLGRIMGFTLIGTILLGAMGLLSYGFVVRSQGHTHTLSTEDLRTIAGNYPEGTSPAMEGQTSMEREHRHDVFIEPGGKNIRISPAFDHTHTVLSETTQDGKTHYVLSKPTEMFVAKRPQYGRLRFRDQQGLDTEKGVNVGDEWEYRSFIAGGTKAACIWLFKDVTPEKYPDGIPLEMTLEVFRTFKGKIDRRIMGSIMIRNPETGLTLEQQVFESQENETARLFIPRKIRATKRAQVVPSVTRRNGELVKYPPDDRRDFSGEAKSEFDLFEDFVAPSSELFIRSGYEPTQVKNTLEIWVCCLEHQQYFGAAQADLYLRQADGSFAWNFCKGYFGLWLQMVLVIVYGVLFSTFLSTPVAIFATLFVLLGGMFHTFLISMGTGTLLGGGPMEAAIRVFNQENLTIDLDLNSVEVIMANMVDSVFQWIIWLIAQMLPTLDRYEFSSYVAQGFNIPFRLPLMRFLTVVGFVFPLYVASYLLLKTREIER